MNEQAMQARIAELLHYPQCWDTSVYPTVLDAMVEAAGTAGCSECRDRVVPEASEKIYQLHTGEGKWIDQKRYSYEYNLEHGHEVRIVYLAPQPALGTGRLHQESQATIAAQQRDTDADVIRQYQQQVAKQQARIAELERVQGVLVGALQQIEHSMNQAKVPGNDARREIHLTGELARAALTEAKKADVMINGLTEAETTASASVAGMIGGE